MKNNIGLGWKDLARSLPYAPAKGMVEVNNEIKAIEYENQGQLKEQVYCVVMMLFCYNNCVLNGGKHAVHALGYTAYCYICISRRNMYNRCRQIRGPKNFLT